MERERRGRNERERGIVEEQECKAMLRECGRKRERKRMKREKTRRDRQREEEKTRSSHMTGIDCRQD